MADFDKDPDAVLDYEFDWSSWLASGETISSYVITVGSGLTKDSDSNTTTAVTVWLSGGSAGVEYDVACKITTSAGRIDERTMTVAVAER